MCLEFRFSLLVFRISHSYSYFWGRSGRVDLRTFTLRILRACSARFARETAEFSFSFNAAAALVLWT